jgi:hypothetical protein
MEDNAKLHPSTDAISPFYSDRRSRSEIARQ